MAMVVDLPESRVSLTDFWGLLHPCFEDSRNVCLHKKNLTVTTASALCMSKINHISLQGHDHLRKQQAADKRAKMEVCRLMVTLSSAADLLATNNKSSVFNSLPDNLLVNLSTCYNNETVLALDPVYSSLFFSKLDNQKTALVFSNLNQNLVAKIYSQVPFLVKFSQLTPTWRKFLLEGIWVRIMKEIVINSTALPWIPKDIQPFLASLTANMVQCLQYNNATCDAFHELVQGLNKEYLSMTQSAVQELFPAIIAFLNYQKNLSGSACSVNINSSVWISQNFGIFSQFAEYKDFSSLNPAFSMLDALSVLTLSQVVIFSLDSNAANNVTSADLIVGKLQNSTDVYTFLAALNAAVPSRNLSSVPLPLSQAALNKTFQVLGPTFTSFNTSDWSSLFQDKLSSVLPAIAADQLVLIPQNISCLSYQAVIKGLDSKFLSLSLGTQGYIYRSVIKPYLTKKGPECSVNVNSSFWMQQNFGSFSQFASYEDLVALNANFSGLDALPVLTLPQVVDFSLGTNTGNNTSTVALIMDKVQNSSDVYTFLNYLNTAATAKNLSSVPTPLSDAVLNKTFLVLGPNLNSFNTSDWSQLFQDKLSLVLPEIRVDQLVLVTQNISCPSYQAVIKGLDSKLTKLAPGKPETVLGSFIKPYLTKKGPDCSLDVNSSVWIQQNFGGFSQFATYKDLVDLNKNFSGLDALPVLTLPQVVDFSLETNVGNNTSTVALIMNKVQNTSDVYTFLNYLNTAAAAKNLSSVPTPLSDALLNKTFLVLGPNLNSFNTSDWSQLFQDKLSLVLPEIRVDQLVLVTQNISCPSYQAVIKGLDSKLTKLAPGKPETVFGSFIKPYLTKKGPDCSLDVNSSVWIQQNFGGFSQFATYKDLVDLNKNFSGLDALPVLTLPQVVDFSLETNVGNNTSTVALIMNKVQNTSDVYTFLNYLNTAAAAKNLSSVPTPLSDAVLNKTFLVLGPNLNSFNTSDWSQLFQDKLSLVLPEIRVDQLVLVTQNISCPSYQAVIKGLDSKLTKLAPGKPETVFGSVIKPYLTKKGPDCSLDVNSSVWIQQNFGSFSQFATYKDLVDLNKNFSGLDALSVLTLPQVVDFSLETNAGNNTSTVALIMNKVQNSSDVYTFLNYLNTAATAKNLSSVPTPLSAALLDKTFLVLGPNLTSFNTSDWSQLFQDKLSLVLPEIRADQLVLVTQNISCPSYQAVIKGLDSKLPKLAAGKPETIFGSFIKPYLTKKGPDCSLDVNSSVWIQQNFGSFSQFATYKDLVDLNKNFSGLDALPVLTLPQVVDFSLETDAGNNISTVALIMNKVQNSADVYSFLTNLNAAVTLKNLSAVPSPLSEAALNKTFQFLGPNLTTYNTSEWSQLFQDKLSSVLPDISVDQLGQLGLITQNVTCPSYQAIIQGLDSKFSKLTPGKQESVFGSVIKPYLNKKGGECSVNVNSSVWLQQNFRHFSKFAAYNDLVTLNTNFRGLDALPLLTQPQVVNFTLESQADITPAVASTIMGTLQNSTDVYSFLTDLNAAVKTKNLSSVPSPLSQALLSKTFQVLKPDLTTFNSSDWTQLLQDKLNFILPEITGDQLALVPQNITCANYQAVIKGLDLKFNKLLPATQTYVYGSIVTPYLTQKGNIITCYNQSEPNSTAWFVTTMGSFFTYTSPEDLALFANQTLLQVFANDPSSVQLVSQLNFTKDTGIYYTSLLTSGNYSNPLSIPPQFLCYLSSSALKTVSAADIIGLSKKINNQCHVVKDGESVPTAPTPEEVQVAVSLVSKLPNINSSTITDLGQTAVGLTTSQINNIADADLNACLPTLRNISGWNVGQSRSLVKKLLASSGQSLPSSVSLDSLGSLVTGLPSVTLQNLDPSVIVTVVKNPQFASLLSGAPSTLQNTFVQQITAASSTTSSLVKNVPSNIASFIPKSKLRFKSETPNVTELNDKMWTSGQASMFFDDVVRVESDYGKLSSSVLHGFTCGSPSKMTNAKVLDLAKAMKTQNAKLAEDQLNCLTKQVTKNGIPADIDKYPNDLIMFLSPTNYSAFGGCKGFFASASAGNISILAQGSKQRTNLLTQSLSCMNVTGLSLTSENIQVLGQLVCDLNSSYIDASPGVLSQLSKCKSFTADQQGVIQTVLSKENLVYGAPTSWSKSTMKSLGGMSSILNKDILAKIPTSSLKSWMKSAIQNSDLSRSQFAALVKNLPSISSRASGCADGMQITSDNVMDELLPVNYPPSQLDACLDNKTLQDFQLILGSKTFTDEQLNILKTRLDKLYPDGYPESVISNLGSIALSCSEADIKKWNITSVDTLNSVLGTGPSDTLAQAIIAQYINQGGTISATALNSISKYICLLNSTQLNLISPSGIGDAGALDISKCNQTTKDVLYLKANTSFVDSINDTSAYYNLKKPYIGGAPAADLKALANKSINMDIGTFTSLNSASIMNLNVTDVSGLLGTNVADLKSQEDNAVVSAWIRIQKQSDLDSLNIGLQGGVREAATTHTLPNGFDNISPRPSSSPRGAVFCYSLLLCVLLAIL
ncbi:mesothelin [Discoglossus pictus]